MDVTSELGLFLSHINKGVCTRVHLKGNSKTNDGDNSIGWTLTNNYFYWPVVVVCICLFAFAFLCMCVYVIVYMSMCFHLLHVAEDILPTVKHSLPFLWVELVDEVCGVVLIGVLIPAKQQTSALTHTHINVIWEKASHSNDNYDKSKANKDIPQHQSSLNAGLHFLSQVLHISLQHHHRSITTWPTEGTLKSLLFTHFQSITCD